MNPNGITCLPKCELCAFGWGVLDLMAPALGRAMSLVVRTWHSDLRGTPGPLAVPTCGAAVGHRLGQATST